MTIPTLHQNITEKTAVVKLKKAHASFENAFRLAVSDNGPPETWTDKMDEDAARDYYNILKNYLKIIRYCDNGTGCFAADYYALNGNKGLANVDNIKERVRFVLADGTAVLLDVRSNSCSDVSGVSESLKNVCGSFGVDTNGLNPPNTFGKDFFYFHITKNGIIPHGTQNESSGMSEGGASWGNSFETGCVNKVSGVGCAAWVIYNENMDYLKCSDLSWNGQKKCN